MRNDRIRRVFSRVFLAIFLSALLSCQAFQVQLGETRYESVSIGAAVLLEPRPVYRLKDLEYHIETGDYKRAALLLDILQREGQIDINTYNKKSDEITGLLGEQFLTIFKEKGIQTSLSYYYSLLALGAASESLGEGEFTSALFGYYIENEYYGAALYLAREALKTENLLDGDTEKRFRNFIREQYESDTSFGEGIPWRKYMLGIVTIYVDLGKKRLTNGLEIPNQALGSGFFIDNSGQIVTNFHVVETLIDLRKKTQKAKIFVKLSEQDELIPAKLIAWDPGRDLALLKIGRKAPYLLPLSDTPPPIGAELYAIGAPAGFENTLTSGLVSALDRDQILPLTDVIQINVSVNPGNSGGPILNKRGEVEGVVFAKTSLEGIAFAIPNIALKKVLPLLFEGNQVPNSWLGILVDEVRQDVRSLKIRYVFPGSPADEAGLRPGKFLTGLNGKKMESLSEWRNSASVLPTETLVSIGIEEDSSGKSVNYLLELDIRPDIPMLKTIYQDSVGNLFMALFGASLQLEQSDARSKYKVDSVIPYSQASQYNLRSGDDVKIYQWLISEDEKSIIAILGLYFQDSHDKDAESRSVFISGLDNSHIL